MPAFNLPQGTAYIVITAITGTIYTLLAYLIRIFIRIKLNPPFSKDDIHCTLATLFTILNSALVLTQTDYGLGRHGYTIPSAALETQRILGWLATLTYVHASAFSILSITFLLIRVTHLTSQARPAYLVAAATAFWSLTATTIILFQCALPQPWKTRPHSRCIDIYAAWLFITAFRALLETANVLLAAVLLWKLRMPVRPKITIIAMFALRLLVVPPALTRLHYLELSWQAADWSYARVNVQILTQVTMHVSTILATVPCAKNFLLVFDSGNLHPPRVSMAPVLSEGPTGSATGTSGSGRRALPPPTPPKRRPSLYALRPPARPPLTSLSSARARSEMDIRHHRHQRPTGDLIHTATRPGPMHTLRMNSWSAPSGLTAPRTPSGAFDEDPARTLATAEHDPEDARSAQLERRSSEESRRGIRRTWSFSVEFWREGGDGRESEGMAEEGRAVRVKAGRQTSVGSCWREEERGLVREESRGEM